MKLAFQFPKIPSATLPASPRYQRTRYTTSLGLGGVRSHGRNARWPEPKVIHKGGSMFTIRIKVFVVCDSTFDKKCNVKISNTEHLSIFRNMLRNFGNLTLLLRRSNNHKLNLIVMHFAHLFTKITVLDVDYDWASAPSIIYHVPVTDTVSIISRTENKKQ